MNNIVTRCPECKSAFRVEPDQLNTAAGMVRCGVCLTVFEAADHIEKLDADEASVGYMPNVLDHHDDLNTAAENLQQELDGLLGTDLETAISTDINEVLGLSPESSPRDPNQGLDQWATEETRFSNILDEMIERAEPDLPMPLTNPVADELAPRTKQSFGQTIMSSLTMRISHALGIILVAVIIWIAGLLYFA